MKKKVGAFFMYQPVCPTVAAFSLMIGGKLRNRLLLSRKSEIRNSEQHEQAEKNPPHLNPLIRFPMGQTSECRFIGPVPELRTEDLKVTHTSPRPGRQLPDTSSP